MSARVLLVDDEAVVRRFAARVLDGAGYSVLVAAGLGEAQRILAGTAPLDLLIADVLLGDGSGLQVAALAVAARPGIRVLYISGSEFSSSDAPVRGIFLPKPFDAIRLLSSVQTLLS